MPLTFDTSLLKKEEMYENYALEVLNDYWICLISRNASIANRKEVLSGKAKFGISGEGKEVAQVALAKVFEKGDFRAGYYRDQTLLFALGQITLEDYFAQLYADYENDPFSKGRQMVCHFASKFVNEDGTWADLKNRYNQSSCISSTAGQVARAVGLATATKKFRTTESLKSHPLRDDRAVTFMTIGDGSTSEGPFWEMINAAVVEELPLAVNVWDDGFAISVPIEYQTAKGSISRALEGFLEDSDHKGLRIYTAKGWDYPGLCEMYLSTIERLRDDHVPTLYHVQEMTQPQGHSTSGSHNRYKSEERLKFEHEADCIAHFRKWILESGIAEEETLAEMETKAKKEVAEAKKQAWRKFLKGLDAEREGLLDAIRKDFYDNDKPDVLKKLFDMVSDGGIRSLGEMMTICKRTLQSYGRYTHFTQLSHWISEKDLKLDRIYSSHLYSETPFSAQKVEEIKPAFSEDSPEINGYEIINAFFDEALNQYPETFIFGEDVGMLGGVNQGTHGLQAKYGKERVFDTGIREWTIIGQALGMGMRGLRPIAEIQYLDYVPYALAPLTDDLATLRYRSGGLQRSQMIIRTRGHRLEGIWHTGSPMGMLINSLRGVCLCVPRNMTQAAGMYNTLLQSDDSGFVIECLTGYRKKEKLPENMGQYTVPIGQVEVLREGTDLTIVTYGSCVGEVEEAASRLEKYDVQIEVIDVQTLFPFDTRHDIVKSLQKTNRLLIVDEDLPGGASGFILNHILEEQKGFEFLELAPETLTSRNHRTPYGDNGSYVCKPSSVDVFDRAYKMIEKVNPSKFE